MKCGGKRGATPLFLLCLAGIRESTGAQCSRGLDRCGKAPSSLRFAGAVQNALIETQRPIQSSPRIAAATDWWTGGGESFRESLK
ncbi:MAG: hypothetical protein DMF14_04570 [Verrucomicrobia bacterium]|nr:MAG: hypothetical protein DMF14_04570 [Verrucomicrobiota bacterium]